MSEVGHNSGDVEILNSTAQLKLKSLTSRIERLNEDADAIKGDIKEVYLEAKGEGFDVKIIRAVVRQRREDRAKRLEREALIDLYMSAIGEGEL